MSQENPLSFLSLCGSLLLAKHSELRSMLCGDVRKGGPKSQDFPVKFPVSREFDLESRSHEVLPSATESLRSEVYRKTSAYSLASGQNRRYLALEGPGEHSATPTAALKIELFSAEPSQSYFSKGSSTGATESWGSFDSPKPIPLDVAEGLSCNTRAQHLKSEILLPSHRPQFKTLLH